ncbi:MAG: hypothetical protein AB1757_21615 [Acidobacteriota bacterium]
MRIGLGILFLLFFAGFMGCSLMLGGTVSEVYEWRDLLVGGAFVLALFSAILLGLLAFGAGTGGKKRSPWRVPALCLTATLLSLGGAAAIFLAMPEGRTPQGEELNQRLVICAFMMIGFALFSLLSLILTIISTKNHNAKLLQQRYAPVD